MPEHGQPTHGLLIDLDGVIRRWPVGAKSAIETRFGLPAGALLQSVFSQPGLNDAVEGRLTFEEWREEITRNLAAAWPGCDASGIALAWSASAGEVDQAVVELVQRCRERTRVVLVTNATTRLGSDLLRLGIVELFDAVVNSAEIGAAKPDARFFRAALETLNAPGARVLFVDDTAGHVAAARAIGIESYHFENARELESELQRRGFLADE